MSHELDETSVDQDTSTDAVENAVGDQSSLAARSEGLTNTKSDGNSDGSTDGIAETKEVRRPAFRIRPRNSSETSAQTETFKGLVENEDNIEGIELLTSNSQSQSDEDRMEDDSKLEDEKSSHLGSVRFGDDAGSLRLSLGLSGRELIVNVRTSMAQVVITASVRSGRTMSGARASTCSVHLVGRIGLVMDFRLLGINKGLRHDTQVILRLMIIMPMAVSELGIAHGHELDKEQHEDGHENDTFDPIVVSDGAGQALIGEGVIGRCE